MTSRRRVVSVIALAAIMVVAGIAIGASVGPVAAQDDDDDDVPSLPAVYHGELTLSDGTLDEPVIIEAVADDEVQDTIVADADGSIGGPQLDDEKLEVQPPDDGIVEFHIGGEPVSIVSHDGDSVLTTSIGFESGSQEIELEADSSDLESDLDVTITDTNSPITAGEELTVDIEATTDGPSAATDEIELTANDTVVDSTSVTVGLDETATETLTWADANVTGDDVTVTVSTAASSDSTSVEVEQPDITDPDPGGVGAQPPLDDDDGDDTADDETPALTDGVVHTETQTIATSAEFGISQVRFTEGAGVASITWDTDAIPEDLVTVETYNETPDAVDPVPGAMISLSEVTVPDNVTDEPATVELRADRERLAAADAAVDDLRIVRFTDDGWEPLETAVSDETDAAVTLEAETPGFSFVAVQATSDPTATIAAPDEVTINDTVTFSGADSTTQYGELTDYEWRIDDASATGETIDETFTDAGTVTVELTVTNDAGETDTTTTDVAVTEPEPPSETDDGIPGFGVGVALAGLLVAALLARRR